MVTKPIGKTQETLKKPRQNNRIIKVMKRITTNQLETKKISKKYKKIKKENALWYVVHKNMSCEKFYF